MSIPARLGWRHDLVPCSDRPQVNFPGGSVCKESTGNAEDVGSIPRWGGSPGDIATCSSIPAWETPRTEEPGGLRSLGLQSQTRLTKHSTIHN